MELGVSHYKMIISYFKFFGYVYHTLLCCMCHKLGPLKADAERCLLRPNPCEGKWGKLHCVYKKVHVLCSKSSATLVWCGGLVAKSCATHCNPMDCSSPGSSVHGILQARILEWVAISFSRRSPQPRDWIQVSFSVGRFLTIWATRSPQLTWWQCI